MVIQDFIKKIEEEFEEVKPGALKPESTIREHFTWDSVNALVFIAMVNVEYDVVINAEDLQKSNTVQEVYDIIIHRMNNK
jgi:acyl carrier protein